MVMDFKVIKEMMGKFLEQFDHALCMNTADPNYEKFRAIYGDRIIPFEHHDPTSEAMARVVYDHAAAALKRAQAGAFTYPVRDCVRLERVRVWETSSSWAEYEA
jgi:6-pyruvoyltetrahydropterin/6-carboxytetrahydropterin synthase